MTEPIGFDRLIELDWLDLVASRYAVSLDVRAAFDETRSVVATTVGGGASPHNATGKTMTVLARVWLKVPEPIVPLRDEAAGVLTTLAPVDRTALHWAMCQLAYPFYLEAAGIAGRILETQGVIAMGTFRARLSDRWGARGTMPAASQRLLQTWVRWGVLQPLSERGSYQSFESRPIGTVAARLVAEARVLAHRNGGVDLDDLQHSPDLFPFWLPDVRPLLRSSNRIDVQREGGHRSVARPLSRIPR